MPGVFKTFFNEYTANFLNVVLTLLMCTCITHMHKCVNIYLQICWNFCDWTLYPPIFLCQQNPLTKAEFFPSGYNQKEATMC